MIDDNNNNNNNNSDNNNDYNNNNNNVVVDIKNEVNAHNNNNSEVKDKDDIVDNSFAVRNINSEIIDVDRDKKITGNDISKLGADKPESVEKEKETSPKPARKPKKVLASKKQVNKNQVKIGDILKRKK